MSTMRANKSNQLVGMVLGPSFRGISRNLLLFGLTLVLPVTARGVDESRPCIDQPITDLSFGDVLAGPECQITGPGDPDVFHFVGRSNDVVGVGVFQSPPFAADPCVELVDPDGVSLGIDCSGLFTVRKVLPKDGQYTMFLSSSNAAGFEYRLALDRLSPASASSTPLTLFSSVLDELNPSTDIDVYYVLASASDIIRLNWRRVAGNRDICVEAYGPSGSLLGGPICRANGSLDFSTQVAGVHTFALTANVPDQVVGYTIDVTCIGGECNTPRCTLGVDLGFSNQDLSLNFQVGKNNLELLFWNVHLAILNSTIQLWSVPLVSPIDPLASVPLTIAGFPSLGQLGLQTTLTSLTDGIVCSDWETVDTGALPQGARAPALEDIRKLFPPANP